MTIRSGMDVFRGRLQGDITRKALMPPVLLALMAATAPAPGLAQSDPATNSRITTSQDRVTPDTLLDKHQAKDWGLQPEEWSRYQELMQGPLGVYSPNLDPLTVLGIEARNEEERRRYAELQVQAEARRVEKLLIYQRAYDAAWQRLYPNLQRVDLSDSNSIPQGSLQPTRLAVFVKEGCPSCEQRVRQLQAKGAAFDLYLVDSHQEDARVRQWAERVGIDPERVRDRTITLNHDSGRWLSSGVQGDLPAVIREVGGQWQRQ
tara:strand:- start:2672 stop:3457 length:786 start_codon:yes stop_codon:yes gene_type:complete